MKILLLTPFPPVPGTSGGASAAFNLIRHLSPKHEIVCVTFAREEERKGLVALAPYCEEVIVAPFPGGGTGGAAWAAYLARRVVQNVLSLATFTPALAWKCRSTAMRQAILDAVRRHRPDVAHVCFAPMAHWVAALGGLPTVMDTQDVALVSAYRRAMAAGSPWRKGYDYLQWLFWRRYETHWYPRYRQVLTLTREDAAALRALLPELPLTPDMTGIDLPEETAGEETGKIGFLGNFAHPPNRDAVSWFAEQVLPLVRAGRPAAEFVVAGRNPPPLNFPGTVRLGFVDEVASFYRSVDVVVAPVRYGGGIKIKVLEAMAHGKPVVTTTVGAEGIAGAGEGAFLVADTAADFAAAVTALLADAERREKLGRSSRELVARRFSWERVMRELDRVYSEAAGKR